MRKDAIPAHDNPNIKWRECNPRYNPPCSAGCTAAINALLLTPGVGGCVSNSAERQALCPSLDLLTRAIGPSQSRYLVTALSNGHPSLAYPSSDYCHSVEPLKMTLLLLVGHTHGVRLARPGRDVFDQLNGQYFMSHDYIFKWAKAHRCTVRRLIRTARIMRLRCPDFSRCYIGQGILSPTYKLGLLHWIAYAMAICSLPLSLVICCLCRCYERLPFYDECEDYYDDCVYDDFTQDRCVMVHCHCLLMDNLHLFSP
eukprot:SAG31_NODE_3095_length_4682_cov_2.946542_4_plen_256_part_00